MKSLYIPATTFTPKVHFDCENPVKGKYVFLLSGESRPEDVILFFNPLIEWLEKYKIYLRSRVTESAYPNKIKIRFKFRMDFFNSSSAKQFVSILQKLDEINQLHSIAEVKVIWIYDENDEDIHDAGEELKQLTKVPFQLSMLKPGELI